MSCTRSRYGLGWRRPGRRPTCHGMSTSATSDIRMVMSSESVRTFAKNHRLLDSAEPLQMYCVGRLRTDKPYSALICVYLRLSKIWPQKNADKQRAFSQLPWLGCPE